MHDRPEVGLGRIEEHREIVTALTRDADPGGNIDAAAPDDRYRLRAETGPIARALLLKAA
jgi:hypothetical protein